jgi:hypothetical protein
VICGSGTGESSAMEQLLADLKQNHQDISNHIISSCIIDENHLTDGQLLAQAREIFGRSLATGLAEVDATRAPSELQSES